MSPKKKKWRFFSLFLFLMLLCIGGALVAIGAVAAGSGPWYITVDASGQYIYVANFNDSTVSQYSLGTGGVLTFIGAVATGSGPNAVNTGL